MSRKAANNQSDKTMENICRPGGFFHMICAAALSAALAVAARADVEMSFAGRLEIDSPARLSLSAKGALAPWRMMTTSGMTQREDGTREFAFSAEDAPRVKGEFRAWDDAAGDRIPEDPGDVATTPPSSRDGEGAVATSAGRMPALPGVEAEWRFTPEADVRMELFGLVCDLRMSDYGGGTVVADGEAVALPSSTAEPFDIRRQNLSRIELADKHDGRRLVFDFREPTDLFIQYWGGRTMSFRLILPPDDRASLRYAGGKARTLAFALSGAGALRRTPPLSSVAVEAGPDWIPLHADRPIEEGSALDFSEMRPTGKPCGAFGRVVARGGHFEFEGLPGVPQRFYGLNLCMEANYPKTLEDARTLAKTLARVGYNAVRIHHHDGYCIAKGDPTATRLDEEMMRRMDNLVAACTEEGLYISTDLFVSRTRVPVPWRAVGVDRDGNLSMADMKKCAPVHEGVFSNYVAFAANWLNHVNSHTGRRYAEEPALSWINLINEGDLDEGSSERPGWQEAWEKWLAGKRDCQKHQLNINDRNPNKNLRDSATPRDWDSPATIPNGLGKNRHGRAYLLFLRDVEARFVARMREFLRGIGCRALVSDMNDTWGCTAAFMKVRGEALDYVDSHFYVDHPAFLEKAWRRPSWCPNTNPFREEAQGAAAVSALRVFGRPFTVSEYNFCGPGRYRGVGGIAIGAEAALQDWAGLWRFAWSHDLEGALAPGTRPAGYFDISKDPMQLASERASVCLFLRRDIEPLETAYAVTLPEEKLSTPDALIGASARVDWVGAAWHARIGAVLGDSPFLLPSACCFGAGNAPATAEQQADNNKVIHAGDYDGAWAKSAEEALGEIEDWQKRQLSINGTNANVNPVILSQNRPAVAIDRENGVFRVASPRTCGVFAESGVHTAGVLRVLLGGIADIADAADINTGNTGNSGNTGSSPATVWASSLDGAPLAESSRILLTHLTDVQNSGAEYADAEMRILKKDGHLPYLMRRGVAEIELFTNDNHYRVFALSPTGARIAEIPFRAEGGTLHFTADTARDPAEATFLYELVREQEK